MLPSGSTGQKGFPSLKRVGSVSEYRNADGNTPLINAIISGNLSEANLEIAQGANVNDGNFIGETALMKAAKGGYAEIAKTLLDNGADPNAEDIGGGTALMRAAYEGDADMGRLLLRHGAKVNARDRKGWTSLCIATSNGHAEFAKLLLKSGAVFSPMQSYNDFSAYRIDSISFSNSAGIESAMERVFNVFVNSCMTRMVEWRILCSGLSFRGGASQPAVASPPFSPSDYSDMEAVPYAKAELLLVKFGELKFSCDIGISDTRLKHEEHYELTGSFARAKEGFSTSAKISPSIGIRWHIANLLNVAFLSSVAYGNTSSAKLLIDMGADINWKDKKGQSALMWAALMGHKEMARLLIRKGADANSAYGGLIGKRNFPSAARLISGLSGQRR